MNAANQKRWYLVIIAFSKGTETMMERLKRDVPTIEASLRKLSDGQFKAMLQSDNAQTACWLLRTAATSRTISARIHNPEGIKDDLLRREPMPPDSSRKGDKIVVLQLADDRCLTDLNRIASWLDQNWDVD